MTRIITTLFYWLDHFLLLSVIIIFNVIIVVVVSLIIAWKYFTQKLCYKLSGCPVGYLMLKFNDKT